MIKILIISILPSTIYANQNTNDVAGGLSSILLFLGLFILMYFVIIRPQTKKAKEQKNLIDNIKINDEILTASGILGKISKITDQFVLIEVNENTNLIIKKEFISTLMPKGTIKQLKN